MKNLLYDLPYEIINIIYDYDDTYKKKYDLVIKEIEDKPVFEKIITNNFYNDIYMFSCTMYRKTVKYVNYEYISSIFYKNAYNKACELNSKKFDEYLLERIQNC